MFVVIVVESTTFLLVLLSLFSLNFLLLSRLNDPDLLITINVIKANIADIKRKPEPNRPRPSENILLLYNRHVLFPVQLLVIQ